MKWPRSFNFCTFPIMSALLLVLWNAVPASAQQGVDSSSGVVDDWTHHHVFFSDPGTLTDAMMNGRREEWQNIVNEPRYRLQLMKRGAAFREETRDSAPPDSEDTNGDSSLSRDWNVTVASAGASVALGMYPAKYTFAPVATPSCTNDFVVFPVSSAGSATRANIIGVNNLYKTTCTGTVPTVLFAYYVGTGRIRTSPVLSLDGTKVAFVESRSSGASIFHVLKLDKSGNSGCPNATPCNGTAYNGPPAVPGTHNGAVDTKVAFSGTGNINVTRSSPFVDYTHDVAYVGDNTGVLHKFTGVFTGTPAEVTTSPWPLTVASGVTLTGPTYDSVSGNIFVGGSDGNLYCVTSAGAFCSTKSIAVGNGSGAAGAILDAPIVDSTRHTVFAIANNASDAILSQSTTSLGSQVKVIIGKRGNSLYDGAFDNLYFTSVGTGHMYVCGNAVTGTATPTLWRVGFNSNGTIDTANDGTSFTLAGAAVNCSPMTEVYNSTQGKDYLFLGLSGSGFTSGTHNCGGTACLISFVLPTSGNSVPTAANATMTSTYVGTTGPSGIIVDNISGTNGASQTYFGAPTLNLGVQASQSALQ